MLRQVQRPAKTTSQQDVNNIEPELFLVPCYDGDNFDWKEYMDVCGTQPACDEGIFTHHRFVEQTVCERIFTPGTVLFVRSKNGRPRLATVEATTIIKIFVKYVGSDESDWIFTDEVVLDGEAEEQENTVLDRKKDWNFVKFTEADRKIADKKLREIVNIGEYFEIQDDVEPRMVSIARVVKNRGGIITFDAGGSLHNVHIANERCHAMGWTETNTQRAAYHKDDARPDFISFAKKRAVNSLLFERRPLKKHNVKIGQMCEVVDSYNSSVIYPGFVSSFINEYYFRVTLTVDKRKDNYELVCDAHTPFVFPPGWCKANGLRLAIPDGYDENFNWADYKEHLDLEGPLPDDAILTPKISKPTEPMRHLEVYCFRQNVAGVALITKAYRHLVWISFDHEMTPNPSSIYDFNSAHFFPVGFCQTYGIKLLHPVKFNTLAALKDNETRFGRDKLFSSTPTPVFLPSRKPYLPTHWRDYDHWLPRVYVNAGCYTGPFINPEKIKILKSSYGPGPMEEIIKNILRDLLDSVYCVTDLYRLFDWADNTILPTIYGKKDRRKDRKTDLCKILKVPNCESARSFAGWMRMILRVLESCPMLFSMERRPECPNRCALAKRNPLFRHYNPVCTDPNSIPKHGPITALGPTAPPTSHVNQPVTRAQANDKKETKKDGAAKRRSTKTEPKVIKKKRSSREAYPDAAEATANAKPLPIESLNSSTRVPVITVSDDEEDSMPPPISNSSESPFKADNEMEDDSRDSRAGNSGAFGQPTTFATTNFVDTSLAASSSKGSTQFTGAMGPQYSPVKSGALFKAPAQAQHPPPFKATIQMSASHQLAGPSRSAAPQQSAPSYTPPQGQFCVPQRVAQLKGAIPTQVVTPLRAPMSSTSQSPPSAAPSTSSQRGPTPQTAAPDPRKEAAKHIRLLADPYTWDPVQVTDWLKSMGGDYNEIANVLEREDIDGARFLNLTLNEVLEMGFMLGPALKLTQIITTLKEAHRLQYVEG